MIITIDGPSGTGKSTLSKLLAKRLEIPHFDTGAMYRSFTWLVMQKSIDIHDPEAIHQALQNFDFEIKVDKHHKRYFVEGTEITDAIRSVEVTSFVSTVAAIPEVRQQLVSIQREFGQTQDSIFEGRDLGSVVFPQADVKIFLTASAEARAERRYLEIVAKDPSQKNKVSKEDILAHQKERDDKDANRAHSPLVVPEGAHTIETSGLSIEQVLEKILELVPRQAL